MRHGSALQKLLLCTGIFASIATSAPKRWRLDDNFELPVATLDQQTPRAHYLLHTELRGPGPFDGLGGSVLVQIGFGLRTQPSAPFAVTLDLRSLTHPEETEVVPVTVAQTTSTVVGLEAWLGCTGDPCVEDFELFVSRPAGADVPIIDLTGVVTVDANGDERDLPPGTSLVIVATLAVP